MISGNTDIELLLTLNSLLGSNDVHNKFLWSIVNNALVRGLPIFFPLVALWFFGDCRKRQSRIAGRAACSLYSDRPVALVAISHCPAHTPVFRPDASFKHRRTMAIRTSRFVSQRHGNTVLFVSCYSALRKSIAGYFCFLWTLAIIGVPRVAFGWHYPSDIVGSLVLGPGCVYLFNKIPYLVTLFERVLRLFEGRMYIVHALLFVFLADAYNLFLGLQAISKILFGAL